MNKRLLIILLLTGFLLLPGCGFLAQSPKEQPPKENPETLVSTSQSSSPEEAKPSPDETDDDPDIKQGQLIDPFEGMSDEERYHFFINDLKSKDAEKRWTAAHNLGVLGDRRALPLLIEALNDKNKNVSAMATWALGAMRAKEAVIPIIKHIEKAMKDDRNSPPYAVEALRDIGDKRAIPALTMIIRESSDTGGKEVAVKAITRICGVEATDLYVELLKNQDDDVRASAAMALSKFPHKKASEALVKAMNEVDPMVSESAAVALGMLGDKRAQGKLTALLKNSSDPETLPRAANALASIGGPEVIKELVKLFNNNDHDVRQATVKSFAYLPQRKVPPELMEIINGKDTGLKSLAIQSAGETGDRDIIPILKKMDDGHKSDVNIAIRNAVKLIEEGGGKKAAPVMEKEKSAVVKCYVARLEMKDIQDFNPEDSADVDKQALKTLENKSIDEIIKELSAPGADNRRSAALILGNTKKKDKRIVPALIKTLNDPDSDVRWNVAKALGKIGDPQAVPALIEGCEDPDKDVREDMVEALGWIGDKRAVKPVIKSLDDEYLSVRMAAAEALGTLKDPRAIPPLVKALKDSHPEVRKDAAKALAKIGNKSVIKPLEQLKNDPDETVRQAVQESLKALEEK